MNKKKIFFGILLAAVWSGCYFYCPQILPIISVVCFVLCIVYLLNKVALNKLQRQKAPFEIGGQIRNVNYLIIGDMIDPSIILPADKSFVQIKAPNRSLNASFEILKHTSSILDEYEGCVIIAVKNKNYNGLVSIFDIPFLYNLTLKKLHLERMCFFARFPIFVKPISTIKLVMNLFEKKWNEETCPNKELVDFCLERNFKLKFYEN